MIALESAGEFIADGGVARAFKINEEDGPAEHGREEVGALAGEVGHGSRAARGCEREEELAFGLEGGEPCGDGMRCSCADDDDVRGIEWALRAVGVGHCDLRPGLERNAGTGGEAFVDFDGDDFSVRAGELGEDGGVIARAATKMKDAIAGADVEQDEMKCPEAGLTVVQAFGRIEDDEGIAIDVLRIGALSEPLGATGLNHPRTGANETLAGHGGEGAENGGRGDVIDAAQFRGIETPCGFDRIGR